MEQYEMGVFDYICGGHHPTPAPRLGWSSLRGAEIAVLTRPVRSGDEIAPGPAL